MTTHPARFDSPTASLMPDSPLTAIAHCVRRGWVEVCPAQAPSQGHGPGPLHESGPGDWRPGVRYPITQRDCILRTHSPLDPVGPDAQAGSDHYTDHYLEAIDSAGIRHRWIPVDPGTIPAHPSIRLHPEADFFATFQRPPDASIPHRAPADFREAQAWLDTFTASLQPEHLDPTQAIG